MPDLRADCARCFGLCCVAPAFAASADFAVDKPAGVPCGNLLADFRCGIHSSLRAHGFAGCTAYDCFGAGQRVARETFGGRDWRSAPELAGPMFAAFAVLRDLHELLWYLAAALAFEPAAPVHGALRSAFDELDRLAAGPASALARVDTGARRARVDPLLLRASELVRSGHAGAELRGADLMGRDLRGRDLRAANLHGAYLIGADLAGVDLARADLIGADLRGADLRGANLGTSLYLTAFQLGSARGDAATVLPDSLSRPAHWSRPR